MSLRLRHLWLFLGCLGALSLAAPRTWAGNYATPDVKVAFVYNFAKFVSWPPGKVDKQIVIGILGEDPFGPALKSIKQKQVRNLPLSIRPALSASEARQCQLLFVARSENNRLNRWLDDLAGQPVLTISDIPGFVEQGGMLELIEIDQRIRFAVNLDAIHAAGLRIDAQLLNLAYRVQHQRLDY